VHHHHGQSWDIGFLLAALPPEVALYGALFLTGLIGGATHCLGMCGPFVLTRALRAAASHEIGGVLSRLRSTLLPGYHLGRAITYGGFGAVAGGFATGFAEVTELGWPRAVFVAAAAVLLILGTVGGSKSLHLPGTQHLASKIARLAPTYGFAGDVVSGIALGFLPCGLVLAALTASVSAGGPVEGALSMVSFALGTALPLSLLSSVSAVATRRWRENLRRLSLPLLALNLAALGVWLVH